MPQIRLERVRKVFRDRQAGEIVAVRDLTLDVDVGELLVLLGPSGSGKTTILRLVAGLERPSSGRILFDGQDVAGVPPERREVSMVFQSGALFPHLTTSENLALGLRLRGASQQEIARHVGEIAERLGIAPLLNRIPGELSGGERQRVALGRALVTQPSLLLLDEPLAALDAPLRVQLRREIARIHRELRTTIIHVTHDQAEALSLGNRVAVLRAGGLQQVAGPRQLYEHPANLFVAGFVGSPPMNLIPGRLRGEAGEVVFVAQESDETVWKVNAPARVLEQLRASNGIAVTMAVRAEDLDLTRPKPGEPSVAPPGEVEWLEDAGAVLWVHLRLGAHRLVAKGDRSGQLKPGDRIIVGLASERARWFDTETGAALIG